MKGWLQISVCSTLTQKPYRRATRIRHFFTSIPAAALIPGQDTTIAQGFVEGSNVNPVKELASLMTIQQNFESATAIISRADDTISSAINELGGR